VESCVDVFRGLVSGRECLSNTIFLAAVIGLLVGFHCADVAGAGWATGSTTIGISGSGVGILGLGSKALGGGTGVNFSGGVGDGAAFGGSGSGVGTGSDFGGGVGAGAEVGAGGEGGSTLLGLGLGCSAAGGGLGAVFTGTLWEFGVPGHWSKCSVTSSNSPPQKGQESEAFFFGSGFFWWANQYSVTVTKVHRNWNSGNIPFETCPSTTTARRISWCLSKRQLKILKSEYRISHFLCVHTIRIDHYRW
jgi:hypothetical protein